MDISLTVDCAFGKKNKTSRAFLELLPIPPSTPLQELVDDLYTFRDCYFETHSLEDAEKKDSDVTQKMEKTLKCLQEKEGECAHVSAQAVFLQTKDKCVQFPTDQFKNKAEFLLQKGRCLNVAPDYSAEAENCLSRAVKLEPGLVDGWNTLGEQYWKKQDLVGAKNCLTGALQQVQTKEFFTFY